MEMDGHQISKPASNLEEGTQEAHFILKVLPQVGIDLDAMTPGKRLLAEVNYRFLRFIKLCLLPQPR